MRAPATRGAPSNTGRVVRGLLLAIVAAYLLGALTGDRVRQAVAPLGLGIGRAEIDLVTQAYHVIDQHYVDKGAIKPQEMSYAAIRAMLDTLGDRGHTQFLTSTERELQQANLRGSFGGIGAEINVQNDRPIIVAPMDGSPAQRAGILPGDVIVSVEGEDTARVPLDEVIRKVRGPRGTPVRLAIQRQGEETPIELTIVREDISLRAVTARYFEDEGILHLRLAQFSDGAAREIRRRVDEARERGLRGIIMDVRNNPGGLLDQAINVTSEFLADGNVLLEQDRDGNRKPYPVRKGGSATDVPLVVLVNNGSASSSEVYAGAIQDNQRGPVLGTKTFGTGTVLSSWPLRDGSTLLLGFAYWLTPNGRQIRESGITPDETIEMPQGAQIITPDRSQGLTIPEIAERDPQLGAAFERLSGRGAVAGTGAAN